MHNSLYVLKKIFPTTYLYHFSVTTYKISVKTSNVSGAGTDAHVFIILFGTNGASKSICLSKSETHKDPFEKNHTDEFTISDILSLGELCKVRIWHDNTGNNFIIII